MNINEYTSKVEYNMRKVKVDTLGCKCYNKGMKKVGRPKKDNTLTLDELIDESGELKTAHKAVTRSEIEFMKAVEGDREYMEKANRKGMYAGMANPEDFFQMYKTIQGKPRKGRPWTHVSPEALQKEIEGYFEFVISRRIAVSVAGLSAWLGISTTTLRLWKQQSSTMPFYEVVEPAVAFIHAMTEQGALDGNVPAIPFLFLAKNYHNLHDKVEYELKSAEKLSIEEQQDIIHNLPE